ncbi:MAG: 3-keto-disaccharide hydrolase [Bryobacteraceae bacterium]
MRRILLITLVLVSASLAQRPRVPAPETGWVSLFNGKDLTGWVKVGNEKWEVEEGGVIHGEGITKEYGYLRTEKTYKDFHLSLRFKCEANGNSGVFFHSDFKPGAATITQGLQFEIDRVLNHHTGGVYGDGRNWIVWPAPENETVIRPNDWNDFLLIVQGNRYISRLNGVLMVDFTDPSPRSFDGYISLQLHSGGEGNMRFKEIFIRDLTKR